MQKEKQNASTSPKGYLIIETPYSYLYKASVNINGGSALSSYTKIRLHAREVRGSSTNSI